MTLGKIINTKRISKGLSRTKLGELCGYTEWHTARNTVQRWEEDKQLVPLEKIRTVSEILEIPLDKFIPK